MKFLRHFLPVLLATAFLGTAQGATMVLSAPTREISPGGTVSVDVVIFNSDAETVTYALPVTIDGHLSRDRETWNVALHGRKGDVIVPGGGFVRVPMVLALPADISGRVVLEISQPAPARAVIDVGSRTTMGSSIVESSETSGDASDSSSSLLAAQRMKRYYADHFSAHEPMYFVIGGGAPAAKFQISFKYRLLNDVGPPARWMPALRGLHIGYTQRSLWDISSESSPFYDTSYMPELLFESLAADKGKHSGFTWLGWQSGLQHESNGQSGADSRSLNTFYFRPMFVLGDPDGWRLILRPKFFVYLGESDKNANLQEYRGYSEIRAIFGKHNRLSVSMTGRVGEDFDKGSLQIDVTYPSEFLSGSFATYVMAQYWTGYGESLLRYDQRSSAIRFGFSLAR